MIPEFDEEGNLPPGIHTATKAEIINKLAFSSRRRTLLNGLRLLVRDLISAGCRTLYLDGSFICDVPAPNDYDACWKSDGVDNTISPILREIKAFKIERKQKYGGDIFYRAPESGIDHLKFCQRTRDGKKKGIIRINLKSK